jgi:putative nucleotidyltransferase with HDIG domain
VGAYYHDIGKLRHPLYFKENQYDKNAHDSLSPEESSAIIINHVTDGVEIATRNRLPQSITDIIAQHHGKTSAGYFLIRAKEQNPDVDESKFTYSGPVPQTKEAAIVMLADSCEAAVRSIEDKTEAKIESMVRRIATERVNSGQFSQCNLTFSELETVINVITKTLGGYFHERIKYE